MLARADPMARMLKDEAEIIVRSGNGGAGAATFYREKFIPEGGPDGGDGGTGGDVIFVASPHLNTLSLFNRRRHWKAKHGDPGKGSKCFGKDGEDLIVKVPCGTIVRLADTGEIIADLTEIDQKVTVAAGGKGGKGNVRFKSSTNQTPRQFGPGEPGIELKIKLDLKLIADVGIIGFPNAGKSTLLSRLSKARPKIAPYPFTTLHPQIGILEYPDFHRLTVCDVPGLIEGAHNNVGLGHAFLRHIKRCKLLVLLLDMAGTDGRAPWDDYRQLLKELELYDPAMLEKPRLVVANKMDEAVAEANLKQFKRKVRKVPVLQMAAAFDEGIPKFREVIREAVAAAEKEEPQDS